MLHATDSTQLPKSHEEYVLKLAETLRNLLSDRMDEAAALVKAADMKVKKRIELGVPYQEILRVAKEENVSLIVAGRERKGFLDEVFVGSITDKIIRHGTTPVYIPKYPGTYGADEGTCAAFCRNPSGRSLPHRLVRLRHRGPRLCEAARDRRRRGGHRRPHYGREGHEASAGREVPLGNSSGSTRRNWPGWRSSWKKRG